MRASNPTYAIAVHGGAGQRDAQEGPALLRGVTHALETGRAILAPGGSALDAVVAAVSVLEDDPLFNAGTGSVLNLDGEAQMDAGVMVSEGLRTGNAAALQDVKNPVQVARRIMEQTEHALIVGEGARRLARFLGFTAYDVKTECRVREWRRRRQETAHHNDVLDPLGHALRNRGRPGRGPSAPDTVGAVARDCHGTLAAATSTGGVALKLPGRVGDSSIPGAGNYACPAAAASATGSGELMLRFVTAKAVCDAVACGDSASRAVTRILERMRAEVGHGAGIIAVDGQGRIGVAHHTPDMPHACASSHSPHPVAALRVVGAQPSD